MARGGAFDRRIELQLKTVTRDATGDEIETWATVQTVWAQRMEGSRTLECFAANQRFATITTVFRTRYWPTFVTVGVDTHRVVLIPDGTIYNVMGAQEVGRKDGVELLCEARGEKP